MRSAALKSNGVMPGKITPGQPAPENVRTKLEPNSKARLGKSRTLQDHRLNRSAAVHAQGDENRCVTRIQGKWAFRILTQLQHGPTQLSQLRSTLPPGSRKKLTQYLRELERASLIVAVDRSDRMSQARYSLSDPLGIAAVHLINALAKSTEEALEPEPKHRARLNT
jgi:DNA-binding HxlR family transcriptional regulator